MTSQRIDRPVPNSVEARIRARKSRWDSRPSGGKGQIPKDGESDLCVRRKNKSPSCCVHGGSNKAPHAIAWREAPGGEEVILSTLWWVSEV